MLESMIQLIFLGLSEAASFGESEYSVACSARRCEYIPIRLSSASLPHTLAEQATERSLYGEGCT
jgi:hypothetical protein